MRKIILLSLLFSAQQFFYAQEEVTISVEGNKIAWYSLSEGLKGTSDANTWDVAFDLKAQDAAIRINDAYGTKLYEYPGGPDLWEIINEEFIQELDLLYNSDTEWRVGAFNQNKDEFFPNPLFDYGWGTYDQFTHNLVGTRIFIIKPIGGDNKKIWIKDMISSEGGRYNVVIADIDGSNEQEITVEKSEFGDRQFAYYSIEDNAFVEYEVTDANGWDLYFGKYMTMVTHPTYGSMVYPAPAGVLSHENITVARVDNVENVAEYSDWFNQDYSANRNTIGWEWCGYNWGDGGSHDFFPVDDLVFFIKDQNEEVWKLVFTGYTLAGEYTFTQEKISSLGVNEDNLSTPEMIVYPNPASTNVSIVLNNMKNNSTTIEIVDLAGHIVYQNNVQGTTDFEVKNISVNHLNAGIYFVKAQVGEHMINHKLVIQ